MKSDGIWKHFGLAFALALVFYVGFFYGVEHLRRRRGPWEVTFTTNAGGGPVVAVGQPALQIPTIELVFPAQTNAPLPGPQTVRFDQPATRAIPFGTVKFLDTTVLPGTVTLDLFGHEIEFLPRTLIIDKHEHPWRPARTITLTNAAGPPTPAAGQP